MGSRESKLGNIPNEELFEGSVPSTPILAEKIRKNFDSNCVLDPRSPSAHIARTPIEFLSNKRLSDEAIVLSTDPRSPTVEFTRTPIIVNIDKKLNKLQNKNLDRVRLTDVSIVNKCQLDTPISKLRAPKLLESSPITTKPDINKRTSFVGLLETNIDYTETNLDVVQNEKRIAEEVVTDSPEIVETEPSETAEITEKLEEIVLATEEPEETFSTPVNTPGKEIKCVETSPETPAQIVDITADVKDFDKKLTNLIYEDNHPLPLPKPNVLKETNRAPLATRNNCSDPKKSGQKLKVSDQPRKSDGSASKIPVLKEKRAKKFSQCENTPPRNITALKAKKSQWADQTLVI